MYYILCICLYVCFNMFYDYWVEIFAICCFYLSLDGILSYKVSRTYFN